MDETFHRYYTEHRVGCGLTDGAVELLAGWRSAGHSQSILSMYGHDELLPLVRGFGIEAHFLRVDGRTGPSGGARRSTWSGISPHWWGSRRLGPW